MEENQKCSVKLRPIFKKEICDEIGIKLKTRNTFKLLSPQI